MELKMCKSRVGGPRRVTNKHCAPTVCEILCERIGIKLYAISHIDSGRKVLFYKFQMNLRFIEA